MLKPLKSSSFQGVVAVNLRLYCSLNTYNPSSG